MPEPAAGPNGAIRGIAEQPPSVAIGPNAEVLRRLELTVTRRLDGLLQGDYRGLVPGHGSELGETRTYQPGDDVRRIDWNVTARSQDAHVRETIADRELETWALVDLSPSVRWGTADCEKRDLAFAALAAVGFITQRAGNRMGAVALSPERSVVAPARGGRVQLQSLLRQVLSVARDESPGTVDLAAGLTRLNGMVRRRGLLVIISDFLGDGSWERPLRALSSRHETLAVEVVDPRELELPDVGLIELQDPETGRVLEVATGDKAVRARFADAAAAQREQVARSIRSAGADHLVLRTDGDWLRDLVRFVSLRRERIESLARART